MSWAENAKKLEGIQELQRPGTAVRLLNYIDEDVKPNKHTNTKKTKVTNATKSQVNIRISKELFEDFKTLCKAEFIDVTTKLTEFIRKEVKSNKDKIQEFQGKNKREQHLK